MRLAIACVLVAWVPASTSEATPPPMAGPRAPRPLPAPPQPVGPPPEVGKLGKDTAGGYKCKGVMLHANGSSTPIQATLTVELALASSWLQSSFVETGRENPLRFVEYRTYDPVAKQWTRIQLASTSGHVVATSLGETNGTWTWEGTATSPAGTVQLRDYETHGKELKLWGEALLAGSWQKLYEVTCARS